MDFSLLVRYLFFWIKKSDWIFLLISAIYFNFISRIDWSAQGALVGPVKLECFKDGDQYRSDESTRKSIVVEVYATMKITDIHD